MSRQHSKVFINYRDADEPWAAAALDDAFAKRWGEEAVFLDNRSIVIGRWFDDELRVNLRNSSILVAVVGPRWLSVKDRYGRRLIDGLHDWVRLEIAEALTCGIHVVPVLIGEVQPLDSAALPASIRRLARCQYARLRHRYRRHDLYEIARNLVALDPELARLDPPGIAG
jgi:hypothetical protein